MFSVTHILLTSNMYKKRATLGTCSLVSETCMQVQLLMKNAYYLVLRLFSEPPELSVSDGFN